MKVFFWITLLALAILGARTAGAVTLSVPEDYSTIAAALQRARAGDQVLVAPGTYREHGLLVPAGVTLSGQSLDATDTVIDGRGLGGIIRCKDAGDTVRILYLTFRNGHAKGENSYDQSGGAILLYGCSAEIRRCRFLSNRARTHGGAIRCINASATIANCDFLDNSAPDGGGGALDCSYDASPRLSGCFFTGNTSAWGGALACRGNSVPEIEYCVFSRNEVDGNLPYGGAALSFFGGKPDFDFCTFYGNRADFGGALATLNDSPAILTNCTLTDNRANRDGGGLYCESSATDISGSIITFHEGAGVFGIGETLPTISCTNSYGNQTSDFAGALGDMAFRDGNVSADPLYCESVQDMEYAFFLEPESPCADGHTECGTMGAWAADCGEYSIESPLEVPPSDMTIGNVTVRPNPFNPKTEVHFELESEQNIRVGIYNLRGKRVASLADRRFSDGSHNLPWNGRDYSGRIVESGVYVVLITGEDEVERRKITLLK